jgi:bifunctional glutamyl/prolyl-tRNA synthetase
VKGLLQLKADYKSATGADWQPGAAPGAAPAAASQPAAAPASAKPVAGGADALSEQVRLAGEKVRQLKADKAAKVQLKYVNIFF